VVFVGRISRQKDPEWAIAFAKELRSLVRGVRFSWLGSGSVNDERRLMEGGIEPTGWLPADELASRLGGASVYVQTAAWEGFPLALLEAHALGIAIVAREIPALEGMPSPYLAKDPADLAGRTVALLSGGEETRALNLQEWALALAENNAVEQRRRLLRLYM